MALRKADLENLFQRMSFGLKPAIADAILAKTGRSGQSASRDYISANCLLAEVRKVVGESFDFSTFNSVDDLWNVLSPSVKFRLRAYTPCLARRFDDGFKPEEQKTLFTNPDYVATEKMNGVRGWLIYHKGQVHLFSRNYSDVDCSLLEYWGNIHQNIATDYDGIYAVDVEVMFEPGADIRPDLEFLGIQTDSPLEAMVALLHTHAEDAIEIQDRFHSKYGKDLVSFRLIAPLYYDGKNYLKRTLGEGMDVYNEVVEFGQNLGFNIKPIRRCNGSKEEKEHFLDSILNAGGEGIVFHYRKGFYNTSENRSKTSFIKLKRSVSATMNKEGLGDQIDAFVTGFKVGSNGTANEGLISALEMSIYVSDNGLMREHVVAVVPNIDLSTKKLATWENADGLYPQQVQLSDGSIKWVSLNPQFDRLVGEVDGQALSAVSRRLEHPRLLRWVVERSAESCIYTKEWLDSQTTNVGIKYQTD